MDEQAQQPGEGLMGAMDEVDRRILNMIQEGFPITHRPFAEVGKILHLGEDEVLERVKRLKNDGYIRRIGPVLERKKLMYVSSLCGVQVSDEKIASFANELEGHYGVTHNYERYGELNVWFTITTKSPEDMDSYLAGLEKRHGLKIYRFPEKRVFKIKTYFPL